MADIESRNRNILSESLDRLKCCSIVGIVLEVIGLMYSNSVYYGRMDYYSGWTASFLGLLGDSAFVCCTPTLQGVRSMMCLNVLAIGLRCISFSCLVIFSTDIGSAVNEWGYKSSCSQRHCYTFDYVSPGKIHCWEKSKWCKNNAGELASSCAIYYDIWVPFTTGERTNGERFTGFEGEDKCLDVASEMRQDVIEMVKVIIWLALAMTITIGIVEFTIVAKAWQLLRGSATAIATGSFNFWGPDGEASVIRFASVSPHPVHEADVEVLGPATEVPSHATNDEENQVREQAVRVSSPSRLSSLSGIFMKGRRHRSSSHGAVAIELTAATAAVPITVATAVRSNTRSELQPDLEAYQPQRQNSTSIRENDETITTRNRNAFQPPAHNAPSLHGM